MEEHIHVRFRLKGQQVAFVSGGPIQGAFTALSVLTGIVNEVAQQATFDEIDVNLCSCAQPTGADQ